MSVSPFLPPLILLVNDDVDQLGLMTHTLEEDGLRVSACRSVTQALEVIKTEKPALIITDLYMPGIDGWTFCRMLRSPSHREFNRTPILVVSATFTMSNAVEVASELGASGFLPIPVNATRLRERVRDLLETPASPAEWNVLLALGSDEEAKTVTAAFTASGCRVSTVDSVDGLSRALALGEWETVVCDLELEGCTLDHVSRWTAAAPMAVFVVVTANPAPDAAVNSLRAGAAAHLRRPFASDYLFGLCELARQKNILIRAQRLLERRTIELHNSEHLMQSLLDSSDQIYVVVDSACCVRLANAQARAIWAEAFGGKLEDGFCVLGALPPAMRRRFEDSLGLALSGEIVAHDSDLASPSGRVRRFIVRYTPLRNDVGLVDRVCFNAHDITERSEAEHALRLRNQALSSISQGVLIADEKRRITYANDSFLALTGFSREEVLGRACSFVQGGRTDPQVMAKIRTCLDAGEPFHGEILNYRKNGEPFWNDLSITAVKNAEDRVTQYVGVIRDVTERKRHDEELRVSQARLQALFDHSKDAIVLHNDAGAFLDINPAACALWRYPREELIGSHFLSIFAGEDRSWAEAAWKQLLVEGQLSGDCKLRRRDGTPVRAEFSAIAHILPGLHMSILRDITDRYEMRARLLRQQRLESVGRLASGVAHDLNNILTPILMAPSMLRAHVTDAGARMLLDKLESGARRGSGVVHQLLVFARGKPGEKTRIDFKPVLREAGAIIRETFPKNITVEIPSATGDHPVLADANQLHQVVLSLAINAADAMPRGGKLVFSLDHAVFTPADAADDPEVQPGRYIVLAVTDHGTGIAAEDLDKIFDPFFTTKPFGQGSGMGLSVVLGIVRDHGGVIRVSSRVGAGSIFRIYLPLAEEVPVESPLAILLDSLNNPAGFGHTLLVVDDEADVRDIVRLILSREGYRVICAEGADAAFSQLQACGGRVDLVITDMAMPEVSGAQFVERLRSRRPDIPILVMSGFETGKMLPPEILSVVCGVLHKPFEAQSIVEAVKRAVQKSETK